MLLILDKHAYECSLKIPKKYKHKQLFELMQMISCIVGFGYRPIPQGEAIKKWIKKNMGWIACFAKCLYQQIEYNLSEETRIKYKALISLLYLKAGEPKLIPPLETGIFRFRKEYKEFIGVPTNTEIPVDSCVEAYEQYLNWKLNLLAEVK